MARWRRGATQEETAAVPGQRSEPALPPDAARDDMDQAPAARAAETAPQRVTESTPATGVAAPDSEAGRTPPDAGRTAPEAERPGPEPVPGKPAKPADHKLRHTRLSGTWVAVIGSAIVLLLLLIFILQNQHTVDVSYFGASGHLPLGVALLLAAVAGILLTALAGSARIMQLRATARRHRRADHQAAKAEAKEARTAAKARR